MMEYRKKPVVIEAHQLPIPPSDGSTNDAYEGAVWAFLDWRKKVGFEDFTSERDGCIAIETLESTMTAEPGDWIIRGVAGEFYPCKPDIFAATYESAALSPRQMVADSAQAEVDAMRWRIFAEALEGEAGKAELDHLMRILDQCAAKAAIGMGAISHLLAAATAPSASPALPSPACGLFEDMLTSLEYTEAVYRLSVVKDSGEPSSTLENLQRVIARAKAASPAALTNAERRSGFSCAKRAADPQNEFAACRQWCGDSQHCISGFDTAKFFRHVDAILSMDMEQREQSTFGAREATPELLAAVRAVNEIEEKTRHALLAPPPAAELERPTQAPEKS